MTENEELIEEWDWVKSVPTGRPVSRKIAHREGIAHEGVHLWIMRTLDSGPELLFQQRASNKDLYPDYLDITVGGHVPFGINTDKIQKESYEEIGISPSDDELIDLGYYRYEERTTDLFHREFQRVYLLNDNRELDEYRFVDGEVTGIYSVPLNMLIEMMEEDIKFTIAGYDGKGFVKRAVSRADFHPLLFEVSMKLYMEIVIKAVGEIFNKNPVKVKMPEL